MSFFAVLVPCWWDANIVICSLARIPCPAHAATANGILPCTKWGLVSPHTEAARSGPLNHRDPCDGHVNPKPNEHERQSQEDYCCNLQPRGFSGVHFSRDVSNIRAKVKKGEGNKADPPISEPSHITRLWARLRCHEGAETVHVRCVDI